MSSSCCESISFFYWIKDPDKNEKRMRTAHWILHLIGELRRTGEKKHQISYLVYVLRASPCADLIPHVILIMSNVLEASPYDDFTSHTSLIMNDVTRASPCTDFTPHAQLIMNNALGSFAVRRLHLIMNNVVGLLSCHNVYGKLSWWHIWPLDALLTS